MTRSRGVFRRAASEPAPAPPHVNVWFIVLLTLVLGGALYLLFRSARQTGKANLKGWSRSRRKSSRSGSGRSHKYSSSGKKRKSGFTALKEAAEAAAVAGETPLAAGVEKIPKPATPPPVETPQPKTPPPESIAPPLPKPKPEPPKPQIFYMTVPSADGRFPVGGQKMQAAGCLYQFEVQPAKPMEAQIRFAGSEADMRNAQAFRDLELLPACTFSNLPQGNSFRFEQTPGRALLEGEAWVVKEKIAIKFV